MKGTKISGKELETQGWVHRGSFGKRLLLFTKGEKIMAWNYETGMVELEGELK